MHATGFIEALDVSEQVPAGLVPGGVDAVLDTLGFEGVDEALQGGIMPAVALSAHERGDAGSGQSRAIGLGGIRDSTIGVMDQTGRGPLAFDGHVEGVECDLGVQGLAHGLANDLA